MTKSLPRIIRDSLEAAKRSGYLMAKKTPTNVKLPDLEKQVLRAIMRLGGKP